MRRQSELRFSPTIELRRRTQRKWKIDASVRYLFMSQWGCQETRSRFQSGSLYQPRSTRDASICHGRAL